LEALIQAQNDEIRRHQGREKKLQQQVKPLPAACRQQVFECGSSQIILKSNNMKYFSAPIVFFLCSVSFV